MGEEPLKGAAARAKNTGRGSRLFFCVKERKGKKQNTVAAPTSVLLGGMAHYSAVALALHLGAVLD